jgi:hypothetical protein
MAGIVSGAMTFVSAIDTAEQYSARHDSVVEWHEKGRSRATTSAGPSKKELVNLVPSAQLASFPVLALIAQIHRKIF